MNEQEFDFSVIKQSGISQQEFADLCGVSRVTVNLWTKGKNPSRFLHDKLHYLLDAIKSALDHGKLPIARPRGTTTAKRRADVKAALGITA